jgi:hypothetical protein
MAFVFPDNNSFEANPADPSFDFMMNAAIFDFMDEFDMMNMPPPKWMVQYILQERTTNIIYGGKGTYKTFLSLDLCLCVSYGLPFHGRAVKQGAVAYVCGEGGAAISKRIHAWRLHHSIDAAAKSPFFILNRPVHVTEETEVNAFIAHLKQMERDRGVKFKMVVFDTLSKMLAGAKEEQDVIAKVIGYADRIRDELDTVVVFTHHAGKDDERGARGSSVIGCDTDAVFQMRRGKKGTPEHDEISFYAEKIKDAPDDWIKHFRAESIDLPRRDGDEDEQHDSRVLVEFTKQEDGDENQELQRAMIVERMRVGRHSLSAITEAMGKTKGRFNDAIRAAFAEVRTLVHKQTTGKVSVMRIELGGVKGAVIQIDAINQ